jgi:hypothetical protein
MLDTGYSVLKEDCFAVRRLAQVAYQVPMVEMLGLGPGK